MNQSQTFQDHLDELKRRLLWVFGALAVSGLAGYLLRNRAIAFIQKPLGSPLYYNTPAGSFNFVIKVATVVAVFITLPVIIYHIVRFLEPALSIRIKISHLTKLIITSFSLALAGAAFGYYVIIPMSLHFFSGYSSASIKPLISANEYLSFVISVFISFALMFQIPLLVLFINFITPLKPSKLLKYQKHVVIGALVVAVILPFTYDPISQFVLALPIIILYYLSIILVMIVNRPKKQTLYSIEEPVFQTNYDTTPVEPSINSLPTMVNEVSNIRDNHTEQRSTGLSIDGMVSPNTILVELKEPIRPTLIPQTNKVFHDIIPVKQTNVLSY